MIINIRGTNGSGKTTLVRQLIGPEAQPVDLLWYKSPTRRYPRRQKSVEGWGQPGGFLAVGKYSVGCGGMDTVPTFDLQQRAVVSAVNLTPGTPKHVVCEGVLASTTAGSWLDFFKKMNGQRGPNSARFQVLVVYLDTPLELCLDRIRQRQVSSGKGEREIKAELVEHKVQAIAATRPKFEAAGIATVMLRHEQAKADLLNLIY